MILLIGAYAGDALERMQHLAAAKKIRFILTVLSEYDNDIVLLNSAPKMGRNRGVSQHRITLDNGLNVRVMQPRTYKNTKFGRLMNLIQAADMGRHIIARYGPPDVVWSYNGRAFASRLSGFFKKEAASVVILEFEDWHFARRPYYDLVAWIDWLLWHINMRNIDYGFAVNNYLSSKVEFFGKPSTLLPGVVSDCIIDATKNVPPFSSRSSIKVGYFGGLNSEKGAGFLLQLIEETRRKNLAVEFIVTGHGNLADAFAEYSKRYSGVLKYLGPVGEQELSVAVATADVILNPHEINEGIFPFKVIEAIASGRLLITSKLSLDAAGDLFWVNAAVAECERNIPAFIEALTNARRLYLERRVDIEAAQSKAINDYSMKGVSEMIFSKLSELIRLNTSPA